MRTNSFYFQLIVLAAIFSLNACSLESTTNSQPTMTEKSGNQMHIKLDQGTLNGKWAEENTIRAFMGIPYAQPPVGDLRWRPPQTPLAWEGIREAKNPGPACWQADNTDAWVWSHSAFEKNEDCLHLNIWSSIENKKAPVMVWFHGGAHTSGMSHEKVFEGTSLAKQGVVIVTANYRLGPMGFLAHPALAEESEQNSSGNYGLLDNIATLEWVKHNISRFGGDSANVTIFGQSAGSQSVCSLLVSPLAKGLFHKAIGQSASCITPIVAKDSNGQQRGEKLVSALGSSNDLNKMRSASPQQLLDAATQSGWEDQSRIVTDGWVIPDSQSKLYQQGEHAQVPLLIGSLANEGENLFPVDNQLSSDDAKQYLKATFGEKLATEITKLYQQELDDSPGIALRDIATDEFMHYFIKRWAQYHAASGSPTYLYYMDHVPPAFRIYNPLNPDLQLPDGPRSGGAYHSGDLAYVFGNTHKVGHDWKDPDHQLSGQIIRYWTNFAKNGDPNGENLPTWGPFTSSKGATQLLNSTTKNVDGIKNEKMAIFDQFFSNK